MFLFPHLHSVLQTYCNASLCCLHLSFLKSRFSHYFLCTPPPHPNQIEPPLAGSYSGPETMVLHTLQFLEHGWLTHYGALAHIASLINDASFQTNQILPILQFPTPPWSLPRSLTS